MKTHLPSGQIYLLLSLLIMQAFTGLSAGADAPASTATNTTGHFADQSDRIWLTGDGKKVAAFYLGESSGKAHGGVLLIPDLNRHPATPGNIDQLRRALAKNHWHTLAVDTSHTTAEAARQIVASGIDHFKQQGVFNIAILGEGHGAALAANYIANLPPAAQPLRALLMINASNSINDGAINNLELLNKIKLPVLDAYHYGIYRQQQAATARRQAIPRQQRPDYQQIRLPRASGNQQHSDNLVSKRIRGWLDNNVAGFMVKQ